MTNNQKKSLVAFYISKYNEDAFKELGYTGPVSKVLSVKLDAPAPCRLDAPDLDLICYASADCLHQHLQVI